MEESSNYSCSILSDLFSDSDDFVPPSQSSSTESDSHGSMNNKRLVF